jgi:hypothetical protein
MRTSEPRQASWTLAASVLQADTDYSAWSSRRGNPHAYPDVLASGHVVLGRRIAAVKRALLTGMSGTGKSNVIHALSARGFKAVDTGDGWCEPLPDGRQRRREDAIGQLLDTEDADVLFVAGCEENQVRFHPRFDLIILLSVPVEVLAERLASRTTNSFGRRPPSWSASWMTCRPSNRGCARRPLMKSGPLCRSAMWWRRSCT